MNSKKAKHIIYIIMISMMTFSCKKQSEVHESSFVAVWENGDDVITKSCTQLSDGSFLIAGIRQSDKNSVLSKLSPTGILQWQKTLSGDFKDIHHIQAQDDGTVLIAAFDSLINNKNFVLGRFDGNGQLLNLQRTRHNPGPKSDYFSAQITVLNNGSIACLTQGSVENFDWYTYPRLLIYDDNLNIKTDITYKDSFSKDFIGLFKLRLRQAANGDIFITGNFLYRKIPSTNVGVYGIIMHINSQNYELTKYHYLTNEPGAFPGESQVMSNGNICFAQPPQEKVVSIGLFDYSYLYYFYRDYYSVNNQICMRELKPDGTFIQQQCIAGFPKLGTAIKLIKVSTGGYAVAGICNYEENSTSVNMNVMLIRLSEDLKLTWIRVFKTAYPTFASDLIETKDGGFAMACFSHSFGIQSKMMMIKTNALGQ